MLLLLNSLDTGTVPLEMEYLFSWVCSRDHSDIFFIGTMYVNEDTSHMHVNTPHQIVAMG